VLTKEGAGADGFSVENEGEMMARMLKVAAAVSLIAYAGAAAAVLWR
jgi:hypothetical protein